jgi:triosephosphate isomerase (TIM)
MKYIFGNWKSNKNVKTASEWLDELGSVSSEHEVVLTPPFPLLGAIYKQVSQSGLRLGVQNLSSLSAGSYTGAVSTVNLDGLDVKYAIVGHSERRHYFGESDQDIANKVDQALEAGITPVVCVDEGYIESQANSIEKKYYDKCIIAYEPISAIGTGDEMGEKKVKEVVERIRKAFGKVRVIYGGSVNGDNVKDYLEVCDGVLVGGASLKVEDFKKII